MSDSREESALAYHSAQPAGKLTVTPTKPLAAANYTARSNLVGVITNSSAVLGLGTIGSLAAKPVMEGKAVLFKKFSNIDAFDIEVDAADPQAFIDAVANLEPTFGAINLEDIKAPECFVIEKALRERMYILVFHDDQRGTAIVVAAAIKNGLEVAGKQLDEIKLVGTGGGTTRKNALGKLLGRP